MKPIPYSFIHRLRCAWNGIQSACGSERHLRIHLFVFIGVVFAGWITVIAHWEWVAILLVSALVISLELINAAFERALDHLHPGHHEMIGQAKDIAAGAVLVSVFFSVLVGMWIFIPKWVG